MCAKYPSKMMRRKYSLFLNEIKIAKDLLNHGISILGNADSERTGLYYSAFTDISQGLERLMKIIIILHDVEKTGKLPPLKTIKEQYSHNLSKLYEICIETGSELQVSNELGDEAVILRMLEVLDRYASGKDGRYYNFNMICCGNKPLDKLPGDCVLDWSHNVDDYLIEHHVSKKAKEKLQKAGTIQPILDDNAIFLSEARGDLLQTPRSILIP